MISNTKPRVRRSPCGWWVVIRPDYAHPVPLHMEFRSFADALTFALTYNLRVAGSRLAVCIPDGGEW